MPKKKQDSADISGLISNLETARNSTVFVYYTGSKEPKQLFAAQVASDVIDKCTELLEQKIGSKKKGKISLVLNTHGGMLETPWPLVNLFREYSNEFEVIVLNNALSAGTLIALGADRIVMLPYSHLSPIDPATTFLDPEKGDQQRIEIQDVVGYIEFVKEKFGITEQSALVEAMKMLTQQIKPASLGSINRAHSLIRSLAKKMIDLHSKRVSEKQRKDIIEHLTEKLFSHNHLINRKEAQELIGFDDIVEFADAPTEKAAKALNNYYKELHQERDNFDPMKYLKDGEVETIYSLPRAVFETSGYGYRFVSKFQISRIPDPSGRQQISVNGISHTWENINH
jgi:ClpP class serine protease